MTLYGFRILTDKRILDPATRQQTCSSVLFNLDPNFPSPIGATCSSVQKSAQSKIMLTCIQRYLNVTGCLSLNDSSGRSLLNLLCLLKNCKSF